MKKHISIFEQSKLVYTKVIKNPPPFGDAEIVSFELAGQQFIAISAGPYFKLNPTISLMVACSTSEEVDKIWEELSEGGTELMALGEYPFSKRYGWCKDQFGASWQVLPSNWEEILFVGSEEQVQRGNKAILEMKKIDLEVLERVRLGISD